MVLRYKYYYYYYRFRISSENLLICQHPYTHHTHTQTRVFIPRFVCIYYYTRTHTHTNIRSLADYRYYFRTHSKITEWKRTPVWKTILYDGGRARASLCVEKMYLFSVAITTTTVVIILYDNNARLGKRGRFFLGFFFNLLHLISREKKIKSLQKCKHGWRLLVVCHYIIITPLNIIFYVWYRMK